MAGSTKENGSVASEYLLSQCSLLLSRADGQTTPAFALMVETGTMKTLALVKNSEKKLIWAPLDDFTAA
jgi:hypothetical protein